MSYIVAGYAITFGVLSAYAVAVVMKERALKRQSVIQALAGIQKDGSGQ